MDPVTVLFAVDVLAGILLVLTGAALWNERRPDDPTYEPRHARRRNVDPIERALTASHHQLRRRSLTPWAPTPAEGRIAGYLATPHVTKRDETPMEDSVPDLPDWVYKTFWTAVALGLGYLTTIAAPNVGETWTPLLAAVWTPVLVALRSWVDKRTAAPA